MLLEIFDGDRAEVTDLLAAARVSLNDDLLHVERFAGARELRSVAQAAHRLKGTSAGIGATTVQALSAQIERLAATGAAGLTPELLAELRAAVAGATSAIDAYLAGG